MPNKYSKQSVRRLVMGLQGLWPGRRWQGLEGAAQAIEAMQCLQLDPLNVVARSQHIQLWSRVAAYQQPYLDILAYEQRRFFDYGDLLHLYPVDALPYWRLHMQRRMQQEGRWSRLANDAPDLLERVRQQLRQRGPMGNRDFTEFERMHSYRGRKDTANALYALWITGEVAVHHREGFERVYDFCNNIFPLAASTLLNEEEIEHYFALNTLKAWGIARERQWAAGLSHAIQQPIDRSEGQIWLDRLVQQGLAARVQIEDTRETYYTLAQNSALLQMLENVEIPPEWQALHTNTLDEVTFLAPLDPVSARGRAKQLFDFEYVWEVYKPLQQRRWGYYNLPVLYGDRLVARIDPRLERKTKTLHILGFWPDDPALMKNEAFVQAFGKGLASFAQFVGAEEVDVSAIKPKRLAGAIKKHA